MRRGSLTDSVVARIARAVQIGAASVEEGAGRNEAGKITPLPGTQTDSDRACQDRQQSREIPEFLSDLAILEGA